MQGNIANAYQLVGRLDEALRLRRDTYTGYLKLFGEEHAITLLAANNYLASQVGLKHYREAKKLLRTLLPVARRVLGENDDLTFKMRRMYAMTLYCDPAATLDDVHEAVTTLEDAERIARRVFGGAHPLTVGIETDARRASGAPRARNAAGVTV